MALPKFLQPYLASYDLSKLDIKGDKKLIITEVLNKGNYQALRWLGKTYSQKEIKKVVSSPTRGMWMRSILDYWLKYFDIKIPKFTYELAILSLDPRPKLAGRFFREAERKDKRYHRRLKKLGLNTF
jgi:CRISPR/Cas system endoribonuclease Cas6 (RAMP superfamily)